MCDIDELQDLCEISIYKNSILFSNIFFAIEEVLPYQTVLDVALRRSEVLIRKTSRVPFTKFKLSLVRRPHTYLYISILIY